MLAHDTWTCRRQNFECRSCTTHLWQSQLWLKQTNGPCCFRREPARGSGTRLAALCTLILKFLVSGFLISAVSAVSAIYNHVHIGLSPCGIGVSKSGRSRFGAEIARDERISFEFLLFEMEATSLLELPKRALKVPAAQGDPLRGRCSTLALSRWIRSRWSAVS